MAEKIARPEPPAVTRVRRLFWTLVAGAVAATGVLSQALERTPSPEAPLIVAFSGFSAAACAGLAGRILVVTGGRGMARDRAGASRRRGDHGKAAGS